jgi:2-methylisocitrate lyase-like PEP mutase family enzyme
MTSSQFEKADRFRGLHQEPGFFVITNAWDAGSARILAGLGFQALATSSGASAGVLGRRDGMVTRQEALDHAGSIVAATDLPVAADLEKGFDDAPEGAAETIRLAAIVGLVGGSIEDFTGNAEKPLFDLNHAKERVAAAAEAASKLPFPFTLTARAENFLRGNPDLDDTIRRLQAFEAAGADVLMAPALPDLTAVKTVCAALSRPFNFMAGIKGRSFTTEELASAGVKRVSLATSLYRAAMSGLVNAAREVKDQGTFGYVETTMATPELKQLHERHFTPRMRRPPGTRKSGDRTRDRGFESISLHRRVGCKLGPGSTPGELCCRTTGSGATFAMGRVARAR